MMFYKGEDFSMV